MKCILLVRVSTEAQSYDEQEKELYDLAHFYLQIESGFPISIGTSCRGICLP